MEAASEAAGKEGGKLPLVLLGREALLHFSILLSLAQFSAPSLQRLRQPQEQRERERDQRFGARRLGRAAGVCACVRPFVRAFSLSPSSSSLKRRNSLSLCWPGQLGRRTCYTKTLSSSLPVDLLWASLFSLSLFLAFLLSCLAFSPAGRAAKEGGSEGAGRRRRPSQPI